LDQRTRRYLQDKGYVVDKVEYYNAFTKRKKDCYGFGDFLAVGNGQIVLVQSTSKSNLSARRNKIKGKAEATAWLAAGGKILLIGWQKGKNGRYGDPVIEWIGTDSGQQGEYRQSSERDDRYM
jgi:hypothetical protein